MRVYIAGPITGNENYKEEFRIQAKRLKIVGHKPVSPVELCQNMDETSTHEQYMKKCIPALLECDGIMLIPGWENSKGARLEKEVADACGIPEVKVTVLGSKW